MHTVATIGVYGFTGERFLRALQDAGIRRLLDVRRRRGLRGAEYAWANAKRLQASLAAAGIEYEHHLELAPTTELLQLQHGEDARQHVGLRARVQLAPEYRDRYLKEILEPVDLGAFVEQLPEDAPSALFCVERDPEACHRSLIAERLERDHGVKVFHIRP